MNLFGRGPVTSRFRCSAPPSEIGNPTYEREVIRGQQDDVTGVVHWYIIDMHIYTCGSAVEDQDWFYELQDHCEQRGRLQVPPASSAVLLSESSEAGPAGEDEEEPVVSSSSVQEGDAEPVTAHVGSPPTRWRQDSLGTFASQFSPDYWLSRGRTPFVAAAVGAVPSGTGQSGPVQPVSASAERVLRTPYGGRQAPEARPRKRWAPLPAPAVIGLATFASATRPASGTSVVALYAAKFTVATAAIDASTCVNDEQLSASAEVVTWWGLVGIAVFVMFFVVAALIAYTVWLFRYVGFRVPPTTADAGIQTEREWWSYQLVDPPAAAPAPVDRSDTASAPPIVVALANGRCFHLPGCQYTTKLTRENYRVLKPGILSYKRCDVCMPKIGKHWECKPTKLSASAEAWGQAPGSSNDVVAPRRFPRMTPEVRGRPDPWPVWPRSYATVQYNALLVDAEIPSETILQYVGAHFDPNFKWSRRRHWIGIGCSQSCGCCRAANEEDRGSGCDSCADLWYLKCVSRSTRWRISIFNGLGNRWQWEYGTFGVS
jgi:hypothetical protein